MNICRLFSAHKKIVLLFNKDHQNNLQTSEVDTDAIKTLFLMIPSFDASGSRSKFYHIMKKQLKSSA